MNGQQFYMIIGVLFWLGCAAPRPSTTNFAGTKQFQLASPSVIHDGLFFDEEKIVKLELGLSETVIRFTLDGNEPTEKSPIFSESILLKKSGTIKAKAFHPQYLPSESVVAQFVKLGTKIPIKNCSINRKPHQNYQGSGVAGLIDRKKGTTNFRTPMWMGFEGGTLETIFEFEKKETLQKVTASILSDPNSWIFAPEKIMISVSEDGEKFEILKEETFSGAAENAVNALEFLNLNFPKTTARSLKVSIQHFEGIPEWHPGKGTKPWLFIDEILVE